MRTRSYRRVRPATLLSEAHRSSSPPSKQQRSRRLPTVRKGRGSSTPDLYRPHLRSQRLQGASTQELSSSSLQAHTRTSGDASTRRPCRRELNQELLIQVTTRQTQRTTTPGAVVALHHHLAARKQELAAQIPTATCRKEVAVGGASLPCFTMRRGGGAPLNFSGAATLRGR